MNSPNGSRPGPVQPPKITQPVQVVQVVQCWVTMIVDSDGAPTPVWVPFQVSLGADGQAVLS